jgi:hypothetical protein
LGLGEGTEGEGTRKMGPSAGAGKRYDGMEWRVGVERLGLFFGGSSVCLLMGCGGGGRASNLNGMHGCR